MRFLTRDAFAGRWLNADGLQAVAVLWMELYEHTLRTGARRKPGFCLVEAELWGFPRVHAEWYRQGIEQRAREWGLYDVRVELKDADTLRVTGPEAATPPISSLARWFHLCLSQELQGLWCELRISARDRPGSSAKETGYGGSLAVSGMLQGGGFQLLALWPSPHNRATDAVYVWVRWEHEKAFLALLDGAPGPTGPRRLPAWVAPLFGEAGSSRLGDLTLAFLGPNERSVRAFLGRIALSAAGAGVTGYLLFITSQRGFRFGSLLFLGAFLLSLAGLGFTVW
ncbi:MAG: hypothetical protein K0Q72_3469, partial [Armatimonadetes bacterium]|nr:hypothetical protein [Armatimonadota bacterium]